MKQLKPDVRLCLGGSAGNSTSIVDKTRVIVFDAKQTKAGVKAIAHENNKKGQEMGITGGALGAPPPDRRPSQVATRTMEMMVIDGVTFELFHRARAHTCGDLIVYSAAQRVVVTGDTIVSNRADDNPTIHQENSGSTAGWLTNVKGMIGLNAEVCVPGRRDLQTRETCSGNSSQRRPGATRSQR